MESRLRQPGWAPWRSSSTPRARAATAATAGAGPQPPGSQEPLAPAPRSRSRTADGSPWQAIGAIQNVVKFVKLGECQKLIKDWRFEYVVRLGSFGHSFLKIVFRRFQRVKPISVWYSWYKVPAGYFYEKHDYFLNMWVPQLQEL